MAKGASDTAREKGDEVDLTIGAPLIRCLFAFSMRDIMTAVKKFLRFIFAYCGGAEIAARIRWARSRWSGSTALRMIPCLGFRPSRCGRRKQCAEVAPRFRRCGRG